MEVREATPEDNSDLLDLQERCPMGTTLQVSVVNTPDFFARAKAYDPYRVFVACEGSRIVGSAACAVRQGMVDSKIKRIGYEFQYFTSPESRRKGIAQQLHLRIEDYISPQGAALTYLLIMEGNIPSMKLFEGLGFRRHRTLVMPCILVYEEMQSGTHGNVRPITAADLEPVAELLNETWRDYDLYEPTSAQALNRFVERTPVYEFDNLLLLENQGKIMACLGFWDWSQIATVTVKQVSMKLRVVALILDIARHFRPMPRGPEPGSTLRQMVLTPVAFEDPSALSVLIRHVNNEALRKGIEQIFFICEAGHKMLSSIRGFVRVNTAMHLYIKRLEPGLSVGDNPVFVDGIDL